MDRTKTLMTFLGRRAYGDLCPFFDIGGGEARKKKTALLYSYAPKGGACRWQDLSQKVAEKGSG